MRRYFLTSYATGQDVPWVVRFHADLERELSLLVGEPVSGVPLLSDRSQAGDVRAATTTPCLVALLSDRYFQDDVCGRQWAVFTARVRLHEARRLGSVGHCVIPVLWRTLQHEPPNVLISPGSRPPDRAVDGGGLYERMRRHRNTVGDSYFASVHAVAVWVRDAAAEGLAHWPESELPYVPPAFGVDPGSPAPSPSAVLPRQPQRVAISYDRADQPWADWIRRLLQEVGYQVILSGRRSEVGEPPARALAEARRLADRVIAILSNNYLRGRAAGEEWLAATSESDETHRRPVKVIPVQIDPEGSALAIPALPAISLYGLRDATIDEFLRALRSP